MLIEYTRRGRNSSTRRLDRMQRFFKVYLCFALTREESWCCIIYISLHSRDAVVSHIYMQVFPWDALDLKSREAVSTRFPRDQMDHVKGILRGGSSSWTFSAICLVVFPPATIMQSQVEQGEHRHHQALRLTVFTPSTRSAG